MAIADVSDKGIPAALFMMAARIMFADHATTGGSPARILRECNATICSNNKEMTFITVWIGILEISTGIIKCANAGHEYPVVRHANGQFELLRDEHGIFLGVIEEAEYQDYELQLEPGASLFAYTDGLAEATSPNEKMLGTDGIVKALNEAPDDDPEELLKYVQKAADDFARGAEQFDDITMLGIRLN